MTAERCGRHALSLLNLAIVVGQRSCNHHPFGPECLRDGGAWFLVLRAWIRRAQRFQARASATHEEPSTRHPPGTRHQEPGTIVISNKASRRWTARRDLRSRE